MVAAGDSQRASRNARWLSPAAIKGDVEKFALPQTPAWVRNAKNPARANPGGALRSMNRSVGAISYDNSLST